MRTHNGNMGSVLADVGPVTFAQLAKYEIPFHDIHFGKPYADVYVDDLAVNANLDTMREIGWLLDEDPTALLGEKPGAGGEEAPAPPAFADTEAATWGVQAVRATTSPYTGAGVRVAVLDTGFSLSYRTEVLKFLLPLFPLPSSKDRSTHVHSVTRLLVSLGSPDLTIPFLKSFVPGDKLLAYQLAFDLVEGGAQDFLENIRNELPEGEGVCLCFIARDPVADD